MWYRKSPAIIAMLNIISAIVKFLSSLENSSTWRYFKINVRKAMEINSRDPTASNNFM